jgi:hypothetical protein
MELVDAREFQSRATSDRQKTLANRIETLDLSAAKASIEAGVSLDNDRHAKSNVNFPFDCCAGIWNQKACND